MRRGRNLAVFVIVACGVVAIVAIAARNEIRTTELLLAQVASIAVMVYLVTYLVWPRSTPISRDHPSHGSRRPPRAEPAMTRRDRRPVYVIGERPAGSRPGSQVHRRDAPTVRGSRGRRPGPRPTTDIRWPASRG
ncbi:MAG: hypothetical protein HKN94_14280 [Acidimicrobiales bacterium]|nr:hypothetical protein [Acidimicrobiales bacterium]RZV44545.1 MAG: hypothetical protein EX269_11600 [Acidimicrobiales bacterium]